MLSRGSSTDLQRSASKCLLHPNDGKKVFLFFTSIINLLGHLNGQYQHNKTKILDFALLVYQIGIINKEIDLFNKNPPIKASNQREMANMDFSNQSNYYATVGESRTNRSGSTIKT